jgi:opacity protein-like surface antigen
MFIRFLTTLALTASLALACGSSAMAQSVGSQRPYRSLFGPKPNSSLTAEHKFDLQLNVGEAYDDDVYADLRSVDVNADQASGYYTHLNASAAYGWQGERLRLGATGTAALRFYDRLQDVRSISHSAGVGLYVQLLRRTSIFVNQTAAYSPSYLYGLFPSAHVPSPGDTEPTAPDYDTSDNESYSYVSTLSLTHGVGRRSNVSVSIDYRYVDLVEETVLRQDLASYGLFAQFTHPLTRNTAIRVGYRQRGGDLGFGTLGDTSEHGGEFGWLYSRPLSATRRALFGVTLGSSVVDAREGLLIPSQPDRVYRVMAEGLVGYQFSQGWQARMTYRRGLDVVLALRDPVFADGLSATVDGVFTPRLDFLAYGGFTKGQSALSQQSSTFDTYTANVRLRYALTQMWATYVEYLYYSYDFRGTAQLPVGVSPQLDRNGIRVGVTMWLFTRSR